MKFGKDVIPADKVKDWRNLAAELTLLNEFEYPKYVFRDDFPTDVFVFCDAPKSTYGCAIYFVQNGKSLLFAKSKVAPMTYKSLSTLELLAVYLALKCLKSLFEIICHLKIKNILIAVDGQVLLAWLLSSKVNCKNTFVSNRLKDINLNREELSSKYGVTLYFRHVPILQNPADLITRALSF